MTITQIKYDKLLLTSFSIIGTAIFCGRFFNHLRAFPRGDIAIFFATFAIIWHVNKAVNFLYSYIKKGFI